ncbi:NAD-dependent epimerase/dehydratase family protein [Marinimicrococcus flavescens]|uniref:NAD(P)-dependent oxidoreductase n=1 Tax=Marinimicrococcus flavescens TaxID=3031815 RepID=A0AAP3XPZ0_9PROT|nr:NAD(P)-dependent oxidoreductase [Marinimicrococcus flavescens]
MSAGTVLIPGARGYVGAHAVRAFLRAGWKVAVFGPAMQEDLLADVAGRITDIEGSIDDEAALAAALAKVRPDRVVSFAAFSEGNIGLARSGEADAGRAFAINAMGLHKLLEQCRQAGVRRVVWASSTVVLGPAALHPDQPVDERAERRPHTVYGLTKAAAEQVAQYHRDRFGMDVAGVRLPLIFGPGCWYAGVAGQLVAIFRGAIDGTGGTLRGGTAAFDLMYVEDAARAFLEIARHPGPLPALCHVNGFTTTWRGILEELGRRRPGLPLAFEEQPGGIDYPLIASGLVEREVGFRPAFTLPASIDAYLKFLAGEPR